MSNEMSSNKNRLGRHQKQWTWIRLLVDQDMKDFTKPNQGRRAAR